MLRTEERIIFSAPLARLPVAMKRTQQSLSLINFNDFAHSNDGIMAVDESNWFGVERKLKTKSESWKKELSNKFVMITLALLTPEIKMNKQRINEIKCRHELQQENKSFIWFKKKKLTPAELKTHDNFNWKTFSIAHDVTEKMWKLCQCTRLALPTWAYCESL